MMYNSFRASMLRRSIAAALCVAVVAASAPLLAQPRKTSVAGEAASIAPRVASAIVLEAGREKFTIAQIAEAYRKNANRGSKTFFDLARDSAMDFVNLFANYRLKVQAAEDAGVDKRPDVMLDLRNNRQQLAVPPPPSVGYLIERRVVDPAVEHIFKLRDEEVLVALIYVAMRPNDAADTARARTRAMRLMDLLHRGGDFGGIARDSSDDPSTKEAGGRLPSYITSGMILPSLEAAAYQTKSGAIYGDLIRVPAGYVILKVLDRAPRYRIHAAHILVSTPPTDTDPNSPARKRAEQALARIRGGEDFGKVAREVSDDKVSGENGGDFMSWYTRSLGFEAKNAKLDPEIEEALFKLKDGEISGIVRSQKFGYHILKRIESARPQFEEEKETIRQFYKQRLMEDDRAVYVRKIVEKHGMQVNEANLAELTAAINPAATTADTSWAKGIGAGLRSSVLFRYGSTSYTVGAWIDTLNTRPSLRATPLTRPGMLNAIYSTFEQTALTDEAASLEADYPEFAALMREFRDGILIFNLEDEMVWKRLNSAYSDDKGHAFYEANKGKYLTAPRLALTEIFLYKEDEVKDAYERARKGQTPFDTLAAQLTQRQEYRQRAGHWTMANAKNADIVSQVLKRKPNARPGDILEPFAYQGGFSIIRVDSVDAPRPMTYEEAKTEVQGDFIDNLQKELTKDWIASLRTRYPVRIDDKALRAALASK